MFLFVGGPPTLTASQDSLQRILSNSQEKTKQRNRNSKGILAFKEQRI
jgi:hypothetical protein